MPKRKKRSFFLPVSEDSKKKKKKNVMLNRSADKIEDLDEEIDSDSLPDSDADTPRDTAGRKGAKKPSGAVALRAEETPQEKRLRLAKQYLSELAEFGGTADGTEQDAHDSIGERLQQEAMEHTGKLCRELCDAVETSACPSSPSSCLGAHRGPITSLALSPDEKSFFSACKEAALIHWDLSAGTRLGTFNDPRKSNLPLFHSRRILCLSASSDGKLLASGGTEGAVELWNVETYGHVHTFRGHKKPVTGVSFRKGSSDLYSCSEDRTVKLWNAESLTYIETLYGHESPITGIDSLSAERAVTSGGLDRSIRVWKIPEETQLMFQSRTSAVDCVNFLNRDVFIAGTQCGSLCLWAVNKKRPLFVEEGAHGGWVSAVCAVPNSDLVLSGSNDGVVKIWRVIPSKKRLEFVRSIPVRGFVNAILMTYNGDKVVVGVGREHRLGRWFCDRLAKNSVLIFDLTPT